MPLPLKNKTIKKKKRQTKGYPMEQKAKIKPAIKLRNLAADDCRGGLSIVVSQRVRIRERVMASMYAILRKYLKKLGLFWVKPVKIRIVTTKSNKRMGRGKGGQITYNRYIDLPAGAVLFEIGSQNNLKLGCIPLTRLFASIKARIGCHVFVRSQPTITPIIDEYANCYYLYQK